jgi:hypothetical protein
MSSLTDLFTPSFFMFLGILILVIGVLFLYFEGKMREQNHKIASMLSLVSTLAEDTNGLKVGLNHLAITTGGSPISHNSIVQNAPSEQDNLGNNKVLQNLNKLIEVSDDEESEDGEEEEFDDSDELEELEDSVELNDDQDDTSSESDECEDDDEEDEDEDEDEDNVKIIKLNISQEISDGEDNNFDLDNADDLEDLVDEFERTDDIPEISKEYAEEVLDLKYDEQNSASLQEQVTIPSIETNLSEVVASDLKTISINLGDEEHTERIDFKKLQLSKLRSIAIEKGLTTNSEAQKLKKPDLLKLLGAE